jgi:hypothetical protein
LVTETRLLHVVDVEVVADSLHCVENDVAAVRSVRASCTNKREEENKNNIVICVVCFAGHLVLTGSCTPRTVRPVAAIPVQKKMNNTNTHFVLFVNDLSADEAVRERERAVLFVLLQRKRHAVANRLRNKHIIEQNVISTTAAYQALKQKTSLPKLRRLDPRSSFSLLFFFSCSFLLPAC